MGGFYNGNPEDTVVGSTDATEDTINENAVTETDSTSSFYRGSPEQTTVDGYVADAAGHATAASNSASEASDSESAAASSASAAASSLAQQQNLEITSASFDTTDGTLTLTKANSGTVTTDLDGRFLTSYTETNDLSSAVTWVNVPNAYITAGSVTQHQSALTITESQISNLQTYLTAETNDLSTTVTWANVPDANITESSVTQHLTASNVANAGALMDSEVTNLAQVKAFDSSDYATAAQGSTADSALQNLVEDTTPQLGGNLDLNGNDITGTGNVSITQASTTVPALTLTSTDDGTVESPTMRLVRNSASQANADQIGQIEFYGRVGTSAIREYAGIKAVLNDVTPSSHDGQLDFYTRKNSAETKLMSLTPTALELTNGTDLEVDGNIKTDFIEGSQYFNSNLNFYDTATQGGDGTTLSSTAGLSFKYDTNANDDDGFKVFANGNSTACFTIDNNENISVTGTVDGRDVATDGARLDTIPYHRVRDDRISSFNQQLSLTTTTKNLGQYQNLYHPSTPVETMRFVDVEWTTFWSYVSSSNNDIRLLLYLTVPSTVSAVSIGTATSFSSSSYYSVRQSNEQWYWVSGNYEHLFTEFGRVSQSSSGSIKQQVLSAQYNPDADRTYFCATNTTSPIATGDTVYFHPYAWQTANAQLLAYKDFAEKYRAGSERHNVSFKLPYTDDTLVYTLNIKEMSTSDSAIVKDARVRITSTGI